MLNVILPVLLTLAAGQGGWLLRRWELASAFDADGLPIPGAPASVCLILLSVCLALVLAVACLRPQPLQKDLGPGICAGKNWAYLVFCALAAAHLLIAGLRGLKDELLWGAPRILHLLLWALCILSFFCVLSAALTGFRGKSRKYNAMLLAPAYTFCVWLVVVYQQQSAEPVVLVYVYELLAIICALIAFYFAAGLSFGNPRPRFYVLFALLSIYFGMVTLADNHDLSAQLLLCFSLLYHMANTAVLLRRMYLPVGKRTSRKTNKTQEVTPDE